MTHTEFFLFLKAKDSKDHATIFQATRIGPRHGTNRFRNRTNEYTRSTNSDACFSLACDWIKNCTENHKKCSQDQQMLRCEWNPTRLVEISAEGSKLCDGKQIGEPVQYATLSHCWGEVHDKIVLNNTNKASFQEALPERDLSQTFKDALAAARQLGIDYIWIDSLCIIQDEHEDWLNESSQMGKIYEFSAVTITATSSEDDNGGCFFDRDIKHIFPIRVTVGPQINRSGWPNMRPKVHTPSTTQVSQVVFDLSVLPIFDWHADVERAPVNSRGWVFQERFMSPRLLHFSRYQLYWECNEVIASESYPGGFSTFKRACFQGSSTQVAKLPFMAASLMHPIAGPALQALPSDLQSLFRTGIIRTWMDVIEQYTYGHLTKKKDKLPAISAVARKAYKIQDCDYLAGLWKSDLVYELGWMSNWGEHPQIPGQCHFAQVNEVKYLYRAPTWSWASIDGSVNYSHIYANIGTGHNHPLIEYIDHSIELVNAKDLYGEIKGGYLTVKAQTIMITITETGISGPIDKASQVSVGEHIVRTQPYVCRDDLNGAFEPNPHDVLAMPLLLSFCSSNKFLLTCLLLEKTEQNKYERVGAMYWHTKKARLESDSGLKQIMCKLGKIKCGVGSDVRFERDVSQLHEIIIV